MVRIFARRWYGETHYIRRVDARNQSARPAGGMPTRALGWPTAYCLAGAWLSEPNINGPGGDLRPRAKSQLAQNIGDVRFGGALADDQLIGDSAVGLPLCH